MTADSARPRGAALVGVMLALMLSLLLEALDQTVVGTALPRIIGHLHGFDRYTWAVTAYLLASTTMIPLAGKLSDQFGRKWFLAGGIVLFLVGSALCGAAETINQLIAFRALQGVGAGIGISLVFTAVSDVFPPEERARWQGVLGGVYGFSSVIGPTLGGWLADHGPLFGPLVTDSTRWRWVFYINLPLGIVALAVLLIYLPTGASPRSSHHRGWAAARRIDIAGGLLSVAATLSLLLGLTWGGQTPGGWGSSKVIAALVAAVILYVGLVIAERVAVEPILPPDIFRNRVFAADSLLSLFLYMTLFGLAFYVPLFLQGVLGVSPTTAGATMTPFSLSIVAGNLLGGFAISRLGRYQAVTIAGTIAMTAGALLMVRVTPAAPLASISAFMVIAGAGMGVLFTATAVVVQSTLPPTSLGVGFGAIRYLGQIGGALGTAVVGTVVATSLSADFGARIPAAVVQRLAGGALSVAAGPQTLVSPAYRHAVVQSALGRAAIRVPPGPDHARAVARATRQTEQSLAHVFEALRLSLAAAIQHGLVAALLFSAAALAAALFVKDVPAAPRSSGQ